MFKLGSNGEIISTNGFDGSSYSPKYETRTSVFLGDMSKEDIRIKEEVRQRKIAIAKQDLEAKKLKDQEQKRKYLIRDYINNKQYNQRVAAEKMMRAVSDQKVFNARKSANIADVNPWVGSPFAGFGQMGEERINPDSNKDIDIIDPGFSSVESYGVRSWMEDPKSITDRISDNASSYTKGKETLQTMVDYAQKLDRSVVGLPVSTESMTQEQKDIYNKYINESGIASGKQEIDPKIVKYGIYALAAYILLK